ncbi:SDR family NAD(P)-dependent oxidoreductase [Pseudonocardia xishanensis]|uniref:Glucose 1-dehydrogenase n=1 Tax=Pseudonocardia xishanensis TaxID=630995 RepID=A0ABP8RVX1_9PSEU
MDTVVVTGGASGIGRQIARQCIQDGRTVVVLDADRAAVKVVAKELDCTAVVADVADSDVLDQVFAEVAGRFGPITGLVNSAGLNRPGPSAGLPLEDWKLVIDVDLSGTYYACRAAFRHFAETASIVSLGSVLGLRARRGRAAYAAAKAGIVGLTKVLAVEWAVHGVRANVVAPAWTDTPSLQRQFESGEMSREALSAAIPAGRVGRPEDVASAVGYLLSTEAQFITGQTLYVDGGYTWAG